MIFFAESAPKFSMIDALLVSSFIILLFFGSTIILPTCKGHYNTRFPEVNTYLRFYQKNLQNRLIDVSLSKACHDSPQMNAARLFGTA